MPQITTRDIKYTKLTATATAQDFPIAIGSLFTELRVVGDDVARVLINGVKTDLTATNGIRITSHQPLKLDQHDTVKISYIRVGGTDVEIDLIERRLRPDG